MATFTANPWVTGEVITADKLNGGKGYTIIITQEEQVNGFELNIGTGFTPIDFLLKFKMKMSDTQDITKFNYASIDSETGIITVDVYAYNPTTGIFTTNSGGVD